MKSNSDMNSNQDVELVDILHVIWKWKYIILLGTFLSITITAILALSRPQIYLGETVLQPERIFIGLKKKNTTDSPENIKTVIQQIIIKDQIKASLKKLSKGLVQPAQFDVKILRGTDIIAVTCRASDREVGLEMLELVTKTLNDFYLASLKYFMADYELRLHSLEEQLVSLERQKRSTLERIKELQDYRHTIEKKGDSQYRSTENSGSPEIQPQHTLDILKIIEDYETRLENLENLIAMNVAEIKKTESFVNNFKPIKIIKEPMFRKAPIKTKLFSNLVASGIAGILFSICIAFLLDYIGMRKKSNESKG
jgi:capsular polysaccharide biosynthesis protein